MHLTEFNFGILKYDWDDPRVADLQNNLDFVNDIAAKSPGFVWRLSDEEMESGQLDETGVFDGNPRAASTLSVWKDYNSLSHFVWNTVHRNFYKRKDNWYDPEGNGNLVMWWIKPQTRPSLQEGMARFIYLQENGETDYAFGWDYLKNN